MAKQDLSDKKKRKACSFCADHVESIDYKDAAKLKRYLTEAGKIIPRRVTGNCAEHQRMVAKAVKRAREAAIINYVFDQYRILEIMDKITIRSDRNTDYTFSYKGEDVVLGAGKIISIADGLTDVVLPTCAMKITNNLIIIKEDVKQSSFVIKNIIGNEYE